MIVEAVFTARFREIMGEWLQNCKWRDNVCTPLSHLSQDELNAMGAASSVSRYAFNDTLESRHFLVRGAAFHRLRPKSKSFFSSSTQARDYFLDAKQVSFRSKPFNNYGIILILADLLRRLRHPAILPDRQQLRI